MENFVRDIGYIEWEMTKAQWVARQHQDSSDFSHIITLFLFVEEYYAAVYPAYYGGFFLPLNPTIWYTHCHYLDMRKFGKDEDNRYRIKCNMLTNEIEDLPEKIQPESISQMVHSIHMLSWIKNIYHDKHIASLHFANKENIFTWGKFVFLDKWKRLVYEQQVVDGNIYEGHDTETVIDQRSWIENLCRDPEMLLLYLNTRNNKALLELMRHRVLLPDFISWISSNNTPLYVNGYTEYLKNEWSNIHFTNWILGIHEVYGESRARCINQYQWYIDTYVRQNDFFDHVVFVGNGMIDNDIAFIHYNHDFYKILQMRYGYKCRFFVPYPQGPYDQPISSPDSIIFQLRNYLMYNPWKKVLFTLWLHGQQDGSASYVGGAFLKHHFEELFDLAAEYPSLQMIIMSCRSGRKTDSLQWNIIMSSSQQVSYAAYTKMFVEELYAWKTIYEAHLSTMLHYHESLLPTSFYDEDGISKELCPLLHDTSIQKEKSGSDYDIFHWI